MMIQTFIRTFIVVAVASVLLSACTPPAPAAPAAPTAAPVATAVPAAQATAAQPAIPVVDIMATDFAFAMPKQVPAGLVTLNFMNHGKEMHHAVIYRLKKPDLSLDKIMEAIMGPNAPEVIDTAQGVYIGGLSGDGVTQVTSRLAPGKYAVLCFLTGPDGQPHVMKGMTGLLEVTENANAAEPAEPEADLVVTLKKDGLDFPKEVKAGRQTWKFVNDSGSPQAYSFDVAKLFDGKTRDDLMAFLMKGQGAPPGDGFGGSGHTSGTAWVTLDLKPGEGYWMMTALPDPNAPPPAEKQPPTPLWVQFAAK